MRCLLPALLLCSCKPDADTAMPADPAFPDGFLWGTSTAGFQVEPGCPTIPAEECEAPHSDWYDWVTDPDLVADEGLYVSGEPLSDGPGFYELYEEDLDRAAALNTGAFRLSLEWARLFPDGAAEQAASVDELAAMADPTALAFYDALLEATRARGLEPLVTVHHYVLPRWVHDAKACHEDIETCEAKGWVDGERMQRLMALYAGFCARRWGERVDLWVTLNEPTVVVVSGFVLPNEDRSNPPGVIEPELGLEAAFSMARTHIAMYRAIHAEDGVDADGDGASARVGTANHLVAMRPEDPDEDKDVRGAEHADQVYNRAFLDAAMLGRFDTDLDGEADELDEEGAPYAEYLGVNYYNTMEVMGLEAPLFDIPLMDFYPGEMGTDDPAGLAEVLALGPHYGLPVIVTENGAANPDETTAAAFLEPHLEILRDSQAQGVTIEGYFYWSLVDNYEWNHGMTALRFGLYTLDLETKGRSLTALGERYAEIAAANGR